VAVLNFSSLPFDQAIKVVMRAVSLFDGPIFTIGDGGRS
jgi:hypothetical protein